MNIEAAEPTIESRLAYQGKIINVRVDTVRLPHGGAGTREVVEHSECVCIVPMDDQRNVIIVSQYRKAVEETLLEIPAGSVEQGEVSEVAVLRELEEETGYTAGNLHHLPSFWMTPGFCTERMHAYMATGLQPGSPHPDEDETVSVVKVPLDSIPDMIRQGSIVDAKSITSLLMVLYMCDHQGESESAR